MPPFFICFTEAGSVPGRRRSGLSSCLRVGAATGGVSLGHRAVCILELGIDVDHTVERFQDLHLFPAAGVVDKRDAEPLRGCPVTASRMCVE